MTLEISYFDVLASLNATLLITNLLYLITDIVNGKGIITFNQVIVIISISVLL